MLEQDPPVGQLQRFVNLCHDDGSREKIRAPIGREGLGLSMLIDLGP